MNTAHLVNLCLAMLASSATVPAPQQDTTQAKPPSIDTVRFLRPAGADWVFETEVRIQADASGTKIASRTGREKAQLAIESRFDKSERLLAASVTESRNDVERAARVEVRDATARVTRAGGEQAEFDCPPGVIVTSAPDWTDVVLMVKRFDRQRGGKQEFAGLWIHPTQEPRRLTFSITHLGGDMIEHEGKQLSLDRFRIVLRGGSRYIGWGDAQGKLIRLTPESAPQQGIVLDGWQKSAGPLRAEPDR
jgi:hypothetical protein